MSWRGQTSSYEGPSIAERKEVRKASDRSFYVRSSTSTNKVELRILFEEAGCNVTDVRVVFRNKESTGVAYVDVSDEASIEKGLTLNDTELHEEPLKVRRNMNAESLRKLVKERGGDMKGGGDNANGGAQKSICFAFQKGTCKRGAYCKFSHETAGGETQPKPVRVCYNFLKGKCTRGAECKFTHGNTEDSSSVPSASSSSSSSSTSTSASASASSSSSFTSVQPTAGTPVCRKFQQGRCTRGNCKFLHQQEGRDGNFNSRKRYRDEEQQPVASSAGTATTLADQKEACRPVATMKIKKKQKKINENNRAAEEARSNLSGDELKNINSLLKDRQTARDSKDWSRADSIRDQLKQTFNVTVKDSKKGPVWTVGKN